ncbi:autotransporter [Chelativorans salis]|uniref:Autotransporter n=1 Tax=Chelativorans salis TaxID=2978478 RepID=A0ABT2LHW4_9HYPH|nr:autotransporter [Chelativorans sp. EGI FJ00035]MCT7374155.1 autotransporter [Chelativorans sp. EGI FJ00035]
MIGRSWTLRLYGASGLAVAAASSFYSSGAEACEASENTAGGVDIVCEPGDPAAAPFATQYFFGDLEFYDGNASDTLTMTGGSISEDGAETPAVDGDNNLLSSPGFILMLGGDDTVVISGGTVGNSVDLIHIDLGAGADRFEMHGGAVYGSVYGEDAEDAPGADTFIMSGGTVTGSLYGLGGGNTFTVSGGTIEGSIFAGSQNDIVTISGTANIHGNAETGPDAVGLEDGDDVFEMTAGTLGGAVSGGGGDDTLTISGGAISSYVAGNEGSDRIAVSGGQIEGDVRGNEGEDEVTVSGGAIAGDVEAETVRLYGGTIGGDIVGISGDTLIIDDAVVPNPLDLRNDVLFSGTNSVGSITDTDLAGGGTKTQVFTGFDSLALDNSTLGFGTGTIGIGNLSLSNGSTLFVNGDTGLLGDLTLSNSTLDMIDGVAGDVLTLGGLAISDSQIGIDLNQQTSLVDRLVADTLTATGTNTILVNLLGTPAFTGPTDIPIILAGGPVDGTFLISGVPGTTASLFTYEVIAGLDGLFIRVTPALFGVAAAPQNAIDVSTVDNVLSTLYGINNDAIAALLGLGPAEMVAIAPTFGVFASGQWAHVEHDGFTISHNSLTGPGPSFDASDFSAAISLDFNAAKHFGFDDRYGLNLGLFGGYASTDVGLGAFQGFDRIGDADNGSVMFGGYGLFRQGFNYALVSATAFLGETDITNGVLNTTGSYDTKGFAVTGSVGRIFTLSERVRFDLRGGLLGVTFRGDDYIDSGGNRFGESRISFGAVKFEPGIYADYKLKNGMVISPYARANLQQRFGYRNTSVLDGREIAFDDADFSAALSAGFNLRVSQRTTVSSEVRGKFSADSSTLGGKIGLKMAF